MLSALLSRLCKFLVLPDHRHHSSRTKWCSDRIQTPLHSVAILPFAAILLRPLCPVVGVTFLFLPDRRHHSSRTKWCSDKMQTPLRSVANLSSAAVAFLPLCSVVCPFLLLPITGTTLPEPNGVVTNIDYSGKQAVNG